MGTRKNSRNTPAFQDARTLLEIITGEADPIVDFRTIPEAPGCKDMPRNYRGRASQILPVLAKKNDAGCGVFYVANRTDGEGRKKASMKAARVIPLDLDGAPLPEAFEREPDAIVETSPGKYHVLWTIAETTDFPTHKDIVKRMAAHFGGDASVSDVTRVLRLPGFVHRKGEPFRSRLLKHADLAAIAFDRQELSDFDYLPPLPERAPHDGEDSAPSEGELTPELAEQILEQIDTEAFAVTDGGGDLDWRNLAMALNDGSNGDSDVLEIFKAWCARDPEYATEEQQEEIESRWNSFSSKREGKRITVGSLIRLCEQHGVDSKLIDRLKFGKKTAAEDFEDDIPFSDEPADKSKPDDRDDDEDDKPRKVVIMPTDVGWVDGRKLPRRRWLYKPMYIRGYVGLRAAMGGTGKTGLGLAETAALVTGRDLLGVTPTESNLNVWYWNGEDPADEMKLRWAGVLKHYKIKRDDIKPGRFFLDSGRELPIKIAKSADGSFRVVKPVVEAVIEAIRANKIDVLHIDPFVSSHSVTENDTAAIQAVVEQWAHIANVCNCAVILWHHTRKTGGRDASIEDARGASALFSAARGRCALNKMSDGDAEKAGIPPLQRGYYFWADYSNSSMIPPAETREWYKLESVNLFNGDGDDIEGDSIGVVTRWEFTGAQAADANDEQRAAAYEALREGGPWRASPQAKQWIGRPIAKALGLDLDDAGHGKRNRKVVYNTIQDWITDGVLEEYDAKDGNSDTRPCIRLSDELEFG